MLIFFITHNKTEHSCIKICYKIWIGIMEYSRTNLKKKTKKLKILKNSKRYKLKNIKSIKKYIYYLVWIVNQ